MKKEKFNFNKFLNILTDLSKNKLVHEHDLNYCLIQFIELEEYEKCAEIRDMIYSGKFNNNKDSYSDELREMEEEIMTLNSGEKRKKKLISKHRKLLLKDMIDDLKKYKK